MATPSPPSPFARPSCVPGVLHPSLYHNPSSSTSSSFLSARPSVSVMIPEPESTPVLSSMTTSDGLAPPRPILRHSAARISSPLRPSPLRKQVGFDDSPPAHGRKSVNMTMSATTPSTDPVSPFRQPVPRPVRGRAAARVAWAQTVHNIQLDGTPDPDPHYRSRSLSSDRGDRSSWRASTSSETVHQTRPRLTRPATMHAYSSRSQSMSAGSRPQSLAASSRSSYSGRSASSRPMSVSSTGSGLWGDLGIGQVPAHPSTVMPGFPAVEFADLNAPKFSRTALRNSGVIMPIAAPRSPKLEKRQDQGKAPAGVAKRAAAPAPLQKEPLSHRLSLKVFRHHPPTPHPVATLGPAQMPPQPPPMPLNNNLPPGAGGHLRPLQPLQAQQEAAAQHAAQFQSAPARKVSLPSRHRGQGMSPATPDSAQSEPAAMGSTWSPQEAARQALRHFYSTPALRPISSLHPVDEYSDGSVYSSPPSTASSSSCTDPHVAITPPHPDCPQLDVALDNPSLAPLSIDLSFDQFDWINTPDRLWAESLGVDTPDRLLRDILGFGDAGPKAALPDLPATPKSEDAAEVHEAEAEADPTPRASLERDDRDDSPIVSATDAFEYDDCDDSASVKTFHTAKTHVFMISQATNDATDDASHLIPPPTPVRAASEGECAVSSGTPDPKMSNSAPTTPLLNSTVSLPGVSCAPTQLPAAHSDVPPVPIVRPATPGPVGGPPPRPPRSIKRTPTVQKPYRLSRSSLAIPTSSATSPKAQSAPVTPEKTRERVNLGPRPASQGFSANSCGAVRPPPRGESLIASSLGATSQRPTFATPTRASRADQPGADLTSTPTARNGVSRTPPSPWLSDVLDVHRADSISSTTSTSTRTSSISSMTSASSAASVDMPDPIAEDDVFESADVFGSHETLTRTIYSTPPLKIAGRDQSDVPASAPHIAIAGRRTPPKMIGMSVDVTPRALMRNNKVTSPGDLGLVSTVATAGLDTALSRRASAVKSPFADSPLSGVLSPATPGSAEEAVIYRVTRAMPAIATELK